MYGGGGGGEDSPASAVIVGKGSRTTSAPTSPAKTRESLLQRVQSFTGAAKEQGANIIGAVASTASQVRQQAYNRDKHFTLLIVDDQSVDWAKYFRGRKLHGDYDIRVEQAQFKDISLSCNSLEGVAVSITVFRGSNKVTRCLKPDFLIIRQNMKDAGEDYKNILLGFMCGGVPCINSLESIYNFQDQPWVYGHLLRIQKRLGRDNFPLVEQIYYPSYRDVATSSKYPVVLKIGHAHGGLGKAKAETSQEFQDLASVVAITCSYVTVEPYVDGKYDLHVQKIGNNYRAFTRKSVSGCWKTNLGSSVVEAIPVVDRYKLWIDEVSDLFGGLDICALEAVIGKDGRECIIEVNDSALTLMGDSMEDDRRQIADLAIQKMQMYCRPPLVKSTSRSSLSGQGYAGTEEDEDLIPPSSATSSGPARRDSQTSQVSSTSSQPQQPKPFSRQSSTTGIIGSVEDYEDTMKNLRKTFAGIFGDDK